MTNKELKATLDSLGQGAQSRLAEELNVNIRTVQRWVAGDVRINPLIVGAIKDAIKRVSSLKKISVRW
jgi:DNA-binding transcriptional regulator YdaS (Cro superfamily)